MNRKAIMRPFVGIVVIGLALTGCATDYAFLKESMGTITSIGIIHEPQLTASYNLSSSGMEGVDTNLLIAEFPDSFQGLRNMALPVLQSAFPDMEIQVLDPNPVIPDDPEKPGYDGEIRFSGIETDVIFVISYYGFYEDHPMLVVEGSWDNREWVRYYGLEFHGVYYMVDTRSGETIGGLNGYYQMKPMTAGDTGDIYALDWDEHYFDVTDHMENELHKFLENISAGERVNR